ncbi:MAG: hypothetical protein HYS33_07450 [Acidobacteria bacterium]|nr:hypothetical protein [Acidobacteriota bacterium]
MVSANPSENLITLRADDGGTATVTHGDATRCLAVPPGERDLKNASKINCSDVNTGDRVLARGRSGEEGKPLAAALVVVMSQAAIQQKRERELAEWRSRGLTGRIEALDPARKEIALAVRSLREKQTVAIDVSDSTLIRHYPPGSFRFSEATPSSFGELKVGDELHVLGEKNEDGTRIRAEEVVAGAFRTLAARVMGVDPAAGTIQVKDLQSGEQLTIHAGEASGLRRLPEEMAARLAWVIRGDAPDARGPGAPASRGREAGGQRQGRRERSTNGNGNGPPEQAGGQRMFTFQQVLERVPQISLEDLKVQEPVVISCTAGADTTMLKAITVVAGVEPLLTAAPDGMDQLGGVWNLEVSIPE